jgi:uncharacterized protein YycO
LDRAEIKMRIVLCTNQNIGSIFTRWFTWSEYSHCALVFDGKVIEATFWHGVTVTPLSEFLLRYKKILFCEVPGVDEYKAGTWALKQAGKPYDYKAVFGLFVKRDWTNDQAWFCSELVAVALHEGGITLLRKSASRVTPEDILNSPLVNPL